MRTIFRALAALSLLATCASAAPHLRAEALELPSQAAAPFLSGTAGIWRKTSDLLLYYHRADGSDVSIATSVSTTFQLDYNNSGVGPQIIFDGTRLGMIWRDNATPISGPLFSLQDTTGTTKYLDITNTVTTVGTALLNPATDGAGNVGQQGVRWSSFGGRQFKSFYNTGDSLDQTQTPGLTLLNSKAATTGAGGQEWSPGLQLTGNQFNGSSIAVDWMIQHRPITGSGVAGQLAFFDRYNAGGWAEQLYIADGATLVGNGPNSQIRIQSHNGFATISVDESVGSRMTYSSSWLNVAGSSVSTNIATSNSAGSYSASITDATGITAAGAALFAALDSSGIGKRTYGLTSGVAHVFCDGELLHTDGTITINAGDVVCWSNATQTDGSGVATCAAGANRTTIAGVAVVGIAAASGFVTIAKRGRVVVNAETGLTAGSLLGTSAATAGRVNATTPGAGAIVGRACDANNGDGEGANKIIIDLLLQ